MFDSSVELDKVFHGDDMVGVEVEDVVEEILELVFLELGQEVFANNWLFVLSDVIAEPSVDESAPDVF